MKKFNVHHYNGCRKMAATINKNNNFCGHENDNKTITLINKVAVKQQGAVTDNKLWRFIAKVNFLERHSVIRNILYNVT